MPPARQMPLVRGATRRLPLLPIFDDAISFNDNAARPSVVGFDRTTLYRQLDRTILYRHLAARSSTVSFDGTVLYCQP